MSRPIERILERLEGVKQTRPRNYVARCSAHKDRGPSLSLREKDDGRVLIHCFAGCGAADVLESIGMGMADLFEKPIAMHLRPVRGGLTARELLDLVAHELTVAAIILTDAEDRPLTLDELSRLRHASSRIGAARGMSYGAG